MENLFWILAAIAIVGIIIWFLAGKKKEPVVTKEPEKPTPLPSSPPPEEPVV